MNLSDLQLLRMKNNKVKEIPSSMIQLANLKSIDLSRNTLISVPENISEWPSLVEINFSENALQKCPDFQNISTLELLYINDNKL